MITVRNKGIFCLLLAFCVFLMSSCNLSSPLPPDADAADEFGTFPRQNTPNTVRFFLKLSQSLPRSLCAVWDQRLP